MTMSDSKQNESEKSVAFSSNADIAEYKQLAAIIVDNLLSSAIIRANEQLLQTKGSEMPIRPKYKETDLDLYPPAIQIDLVGTRTPSPEEEPLFDWSIDRKQYRFKSPAVDQQSTSIDTDFSINDFELSDRENDSICRHDSTYDNSSKNIELDEVRNFAKEYVTHVIGSALEAVNTQITEKSKSLLKSSRSDNQCFESGVWMSRIRHLFRQLMRSACLCKSREQFRQRKC